MSSSWNKHRPKLLDQPKDIQKADENPVRSQPAELKGLLAGYGIGRKRSGRAVVAVDCSGSMSTSDKLKQAKQGSIAFAEDALKQGYLVGLASFGSTGQLLIPCTSDLSKLREGAERLEIDGSTNMLAGLEVSGKELADAGAIRAIVIATDGVPDEPDATLELAEKLKSQSIDIIAIGTVDADEDFLRRLASRSDLAKVVTSSGLLAGITQAARLLPPVAKP
jgi:Mg-chelatase subunit ChlD